MDKYESIRANEKIMDEAREAQEELRAALSRIEEGRSDWQKLMEYYSSDERYEHLRDDEEGLIPENLKRGVLSEDGIWNMAEERRALALRMMETGLSMLKED